ncbi:ethanolamine utilization protein EutN [Candidatus Poribacteria bacterium]|nr:ethanolamine utilization protein EutN [Candidatus Poribacteria bacterium]
MTLGKVVGTIVATQKDEKLTGGKLLVVQEMALDGEMLERYAVAVDSVGAGMHEVVLVAMGSSARLTVATQDRPVDAVIMAIVDSVEILGDTVYRK